MDDSLYDKLAAKIIRGPYVKVTNLDTEKRTLVLAPVEIAEEFKGFKYNFETRFNLIVSDSVQKEIQLRHEINIALNYLGEKFNEIGFEYRIGEDGEEIRTFNWAKYVKYDFNSLTTDNGWDNLYRNTKPDSSGEYEMDDGHMFGSEYDAEAEELVRKQIKKIQELFEKFKKEKIFQLSKGINTNKYLPNKTEKTSGNESSVINLYRLKFSKDEDKVRVYDLIKELFPGREVDLSLAINGEEIVKKLLYLGNQNQFAELFRRIKRNKIISNNYVQIVDWLCKYFEFQYHLGEKTEIRAFNSNTVYDIINKNKGVPTKENRICEVDWLPFKN